MEILLLVWGNCCKGLGSGVTFVGSLVRGEREEESWRGRVGMEVRKGKRRRVRVEDEKGLVVLLRVEENKRFRFRVVRRNGGML